MSFTLDIKGIANQNIAVVAEVGIPVFILGANGTGKSSLILDLYRAHVKTAVRISAHRQSWFSSGEAVAPQEFRQFTSTIQHLDSTAESRWREHTGDQRPRMAITQLVNAENSRARR